MISSAISCKFLLDLPGRYIKKTVGDKWETADMLQYLTIPKSFGQRFLLELPLRSASYRRETSGQPYVVYVPWSADRKEPGGNGFWQVIGQLFKVIKSLHFVKVSSHCSLSHVNAGIMISFFISRRLVHDIPSQ